VERGGALLRHLCQPDNMVGSNEPEAAPALASIAWLPFQKEPNAKDAAAGLPWAEGGALALAPPRAVRPSADAWLASACCRLLPPELERGLAQPPTQGRISQLLGWSLPPPPQVLAAQLHQLSARHAVAAAAGDAEALLALCLALDAQTPRIYSLLEGHLASGEGAAELVSAQLRECACLWLGSGLGWALPQRCALDATAAYAPYILPAPPCCADGHGRLMVALGCTASLGAPEYAAALRAMAAAEPQPLSEEALPLALELAERCAESLEKGHTGGPSHAGPILLPDAEKRFAEASTLLFNDAAWAAPEMAGEGGSLRLCHPRLAASAAERCGARSLRQLLLLDQNQTDRLPCPPASALRELLAGFDDLAHVLYDIIETADGLLCSSLDICLDTRQHGRLSLVSPLLAAFQGPALMLTLRFPGEPLSDAELCELLSAPAPRLRAGRCARGGHGLLGAWHATDLVSVLSGPRLAIFDPSGGVLGLDERAEGRSGRSALGKSYAFAGTDLARRFVDQFAPFADALGGDLGRPFQGAVVRMPLRSAAGALGRPALSLEAASGLLRTFAELAGERSLLFAASLAALRLRETGAGGEGSTLMDVSVVAGGPPRVGGLVDDREWRKQSLFSLIAGASAVRRSAHVTLRHSDGREERYLVAGVLGGGRARDAALERTNLGLSLLPFAAAAVRLPSGDDDPGPNSQGSLFAPSPLPDDPSGLNRLSPLNLFACFSLLRAPVRRLLPPPPPAESGAPSRAVWNRELLATLVAAAADALTEAAAVDAVWAYGLWPRRAALQGAPDAEALTHSFLRPLLCALAERPALRLRSGQLARATDGLFMPAAAGGDAARALAALPATAAASIFDAPPELRAELAAAGVTGLRELTPASLRGLLRAAPPPARPPPVAEAVALLRFLLADCEAAAVAEGAAEPLPPPPQSLAQLIGEAGAELFGVPPPPPPLQPPPRTGLVFERLRELAGLPFPRADGSSGAFGGPLAASAREAALVAPPQFEAACLLAPSALPRLVHPAAVAALPQFFQHPGFQAATGLRALTLERLAPLLPASLPPRCRAGGPPTVSWQPGGEGEAAEPSAEWLCALWAHVGSAAAESPAERRAALLEPLGSLALLPLREGGLLRVQHRSALFVEPPGGGGGGGVLGALADALAAPPSAAQARSAAQLWPQLRPALLALRAPLLSAEAPPAARELLSGEPGEAPPGALRTAADEVAWRLRAASEAGLPLSWPELGKPEREALFSLFASSQAGAGWLSTPPGIAYLRSLPIFATADGEWTALEGGGFATCAPESLAFVTGSAGAVSRLLAHRPAPAARAFTAALGVPELSDSDVLAQMVLPRWAALDARGRDAALAYTAKHWPRLRSSEGLLAALRAAPFLTASLADGSDASTSLTRAADLLDPNIPFLASAFAGQRVFPALQWRAAALAPLLADAGLVRGLAAPAMLAAARRIEAAAAGGEEGAAAAAVAAAAALLSHLFSRGVGDSYSADELKALANVAFVPALSPGTPGGEAAAASAAAPPVLCRFSDALLPADWPLGWAAAPTLLPTSAPPPALRGRLGLRSPPVFATFAAHLRAVGGDDAGEAMLSAWPAAAGEPEAAFEAAVTHLAGLWAGLSAPQRAELRAARFVPVQNCSRLAAAERLYVGGLCGCALAPLAHALPARFAAAAATLRALGARDEPSGEEAVELLRAAHAAAAAGAPLNPDELRACLCCARLAAEAGDAGAAAAAIADGSLPLPDAAGALWPAAQCGGRRMHPALAASPALLARLRLQGAAGGEPDDSFLAAAPDAAACPPGARVSAEHAGLAQRRPARPLSAGETVALRAPLPPAEAARRAALARQEGAAAPEQPLRYARVLASARPSAADPVVRVRLLLGPGHAESVLSTEVLVFRATRLYGGGGADDPPQRQPPAPEPGVAAGEAATAIRNLLAAAQLPLGLEQEALLSQTLELRQKLGQAEREGEALRAAAAEAVAEAEAVGKALCCPITQALFVDPVCAADGHTYERAAITTWLASHDTSPATNRRLASRELKPNYAAKGAVLALRAAEAARGRRAAEAERTPAAS